jgi:3-oxoacyl-[acyl-carrier-protein] synthase-3
MDLVQNYPGGLMFGARVTGTVSHLVEQILTNIEPEAIFNSSSESIRKRTEIEERRQAAPGESMSDLPVSMAQEALKTGRCKCKGQHLFASFDAGLT